MKIYRSAAFFSLILAALLVIAFFVQRTMGSDVHTLALYHGLNYGVALLTVFLMVWQAEKRPDTLGFMFMGGSLLKFALFFVLVYPGLSESRAERKAEFLVFFVPYALTLLGEVTYLLKFLNKRA